MKKYKEGEAKQRGVHVEVGRARGQRELPLSHISYRPITELGYLTRS